MRSLAGSDYSLADWSTHRVQLTEKAAPNLGRYQGSADDTKGYDWAVFSGANQPDSWDERVAIVDLRHSAIVEEVQRVPRSSTALTAGAASRWTNVGTATDRDDVTIGAVS